MSLKPSFGVEHTLSAASRRMTETMAHTLAQRCWEVENL